MVPVAFKSVFSSSHSLADEIVDVFAARDVGRTSPWIDRIQSKAGTCSSTWKKTRNRGTSPGVRFISIRKGEIKDCLITRFSVECFIFSLRATPLLKYSLKRS